MDPLNMDAFIPAMSSRHKIVLDPILGPITMVMLASNREHSCRNPFLALVDTIILSSAETIDFERCYWTTDGFYAGIMGSTETTGGLYNRDFHVHPKIERDARDCMLVVRVRREDTGPWTQSRISLDPSAPEAVHELFAALVGHIPNASLEFRLPVIARLLLEGRYGHEGLGFAQMIDEARARLG
ncbi:MAG: hypothetical protein Q9168_006851 [Polycauliona sp. 1 TL-2023]